MLIIARTTGVQTVVINSNYNTRDVWYILASIAWKLKNHHINGAFSPRGSDPITLAYNQINSQRL